MFTLGEFILALLAGAFLGGLGVALMVMTRGPSFDVAAPVQAMKPLNHLFARRGEMVTCVNGHVICVVDRDIVRGERANIQNQFTDWHQPMPDPAAVIPACAQCGDIWFMNDHLHGMRLHISGDWR